MIHRRSNFPKYPILIGILFSAFVSCSNAADFPLPLENRKSGISLSLSGSNGADWAVEHTYHDRSIADQVIYLKSSVDMSLEHNQRNAITMSCKLPHVLGTSGPDGVANSGDEGDIYWKIDRDGQSHKFQTKGGTTLPDYCVKYAGRFNFEKLTYDGTMPVLGTTGDNGGPWGSQPMTTDEHFAYGQLDQAGNEWHTLTYWDDDEPLLAAARIESHRQGASDGHCVFMCVNPKTPVIQFLAEGDEQFYTTPVKTYYIPKIWSRTTYLTGGVQLNFVNLANGDAVEYRVDGGTWKTFDGRPLVVSDIVTKDNQAATLEYRCGSTGVIDRRTIVLNPEIPAKSERHGYLLWASEDERQAVIGKLHEIEPFRTSYQMFRKSYTQGMPYQPSDTRGQWRATASMSERSLANALVVAVGGADRAIDEALTCKTRLLRLARLQPVGFEDNVNSATPAKDFMNELGQTIQCFADAGVAYDLLAAHFRSTDHAEGLTPIEEIFIRDSLGKVAKTILQVRANWSAISGGGDTHWSHGYELVLGIVSLAMPTYKTDYYGVSGGDRKTRNDTADADGKYWNPLPDQAVTWYQCATDPDIDTPGHPNVRYPFRAEFQYTDDGWWTGPNDMQGDGNRYFSGPVSRRLVDVTGAGLANAECRVELVEMSGYEAPFVDRVHVFDNARRILGYDDRATCLTNYIRRRLIGGYVPLAWDPKTKTYSAGEPVISSSLYAFNNHYEFASLSGPRALAGRFLNELNIYYGFTKGELDPKRRERIAANDRKVLYNAYVLALCCAPSQIVNQAGDSNHAPIVKPLMKHVVRPGETIRKDIIAIDPDCDPLTITVDELPRNATFDARERRITWIPTATDAGVHVVTVSASDSSITTSRPFLMIVKADAPAGPIPPAPTNVTARLSADRTSVEIDWQPPESVDVAYYAIYRDGALFDVTEAGTTTWTDRTILPSTNTRYYVSALAKTGAESQASQTEPAMIRTRPEP